MFIFLHLRVDIPALRKLNGKVDQVRAVENG